MAQQKALTGSGIPGQTAIAILGSPAAVTAAGTSAATATLLPSSFSNVTAASSLDGVVLPTTAQGSVFGDFFVVGNVGSTTAKVYPASGETIAGSSSAISVAQNKVGMFFRMSTTAWLHFVTA